MRVQIQGLPKNLQVLTPLVGWSLFMWAPDHLAPETPSWTASHWQILALALALDLSAFWVPFLLAL